ncbi:MAG TPA: VWA domain-containing protein [Blastocatellia bacterium]|nr:VWA domain-containing protein [Blastocatellia bacterium]
MKMTIPLFLILSFSVFVVGARAQDARRDDVIKIDTNLVSVPVVVRDRQGRYVPGLKVEDFTLYQDGVKQTISFFGAEEEQLNVALLLDSSRSAIDAMEQIRDAAQDFIRLLRPADRAMVMSFDHSARALSPLTSDRKRLQNAVDQVDIGARIGTVMRDAVIEVVEQYFAPVKGRKAIILLTDGKDFGSSISKDELLDVLEESDVMVYSVFYQTSVGSFGRRRGIWRRGRRGERANENAIDYLELMSEVSAGRFYQNEVADLRATFNLIADELRKQYRLGYYPPDSEDGSAAHKITVKVARPDVAVRSRGNYRTK